MFLNSGTQKIIRLDYGLVLKPMVRTGDPPWLKRNPPIISGISEYHKIIKDDLRISGPQSMIIPSGNLTLLLKMIIYSGFSH